MTLYYLSSYWSYFFAWSVYDESQKLVNDNGTSEERFSILASAVRGIPRSSTLGKVGRLWWHEMSLELNAKSIKCSSAVVVSLGQNSYSLHWISGLGEKKKQPTPTILRFELLISFFFPSEWLSKSII